MYRITLMPCVGAGSADGTSRSFWGGGGLGRQLDGAVCSFSALEKITASSRVCRTQEQGNFTVLFDG